VYLVMALRYLVTGLKHMALPTPGQVSASPLPPNAARLATRLASQLLCSQDFRGALAQRLERLRRSGGSPGQLTELLLEASHAACNCCRSGGDLGLMAVMADARLAAAAAQVLEQLSLRGDLVRGRCSSCGCCQRERSSKAASAAMPRPDHLRLSRASLLDARHRPPCSAQQPRLVADSAVASSRMLLVSKLTADCLTA
jgi:hypothetical protein